MSTLKSKFISAPVNGPTVEPLVLQTNNIDRLTIASDGTITSADGFTDSSNRLRPLVSDTAKTATSTSVDFTGIPSWAKRVTVMLNGVSTNGSSNIRMRLGTSGGIETTGYSSTCGQVGGNTGTAGTSTAGFDGFGDGGAVFTRSGQWVFTLLGSNIWALSGAFNIGTANAFQYVISGAKTLSNTLSQVRITTVNGTDTFDAGTINIMWE